MLPFTIRIGRTVTRRPAAVLIAATAWAICGNALATPLDKPVRVQSGLVQGQPSTRPGIMVFKGIPYAAPPVGDLRWRAPRPALEFKTTLRADHATPDCPQNNPPSGASPAAAQSEDCLHLNLWTAARDSAERRPVMVWFYGGGFRSGTINTPVLDGVSLASKGVIFIAVNYRLGAMGFLAHPALSAESKQHVSGNYGLLDMLAALQWVHGNVAAFGGDPGRVTIFGQSAGSMAVSLLVASPLAKGLFQRVIGQSGAALGANVYTTLKPLSFGEQRGLAFTAPLGAKTAAQLRALPVGAFLEAAADAEVGLLDPVIDGYFLESDVRETFQRGKQNDVPTLVGNTTNESTQGRPPASAKVYRDAIAKCYSPEDAKLFLAMFPGNTDVEAVSSSNAANNLLLGPWTMRSWVQLQHATGTAPIYFYSFDQTPPVTPSRGAYHGADKYYSFNNLEALAIPWSAADRRLADIMSSYWVNFATYGDPNGAGLPAWLPFDPSTERVMWFNGETPAMRAVPDSIALGYMDRLKAAQRERPPEQRC